MVHRMEYPRPQFVREDWANLNGTWQFEFDDNNVGASRKWYTGDSFFTRKIEVPYAYQTKLSGIGDPSFHDVVWYRREFTVNEAWKGKRVLLHFGAVDYRAWVYVNGQFVGTHEGGNVPFHFDITDELTWEREQVTVRVEDPSTEETIPRGKQFWIEKPEAIWYTRTTGIWQTVWLEAVRPTRIEKVKYYPNVDTGEVAIEWETTGDYKGKEAEIRISFKGELVASDLVRLQSAYTKRTIHVFNRHIFRTPYHHNGWTWSPETPNLFDVTFLLKDADTELDRVQSYFGMRKVHIENGMVYLNNKPYYQKLVLDQGYWPEGLLTAPSDEDLKKDIELAKQMGFNGCRKHQKVEDPRFLYWADVLGYIVWGECASSPSYSEDAAARLTREWIEIVERDFNHPSILAWVPLNESWGIPMVRSSGQQQHHSLAMYHLIHSLDTTRLVISNDGWELTKSDICAIHNYNHGAPGETGKYEYYKQSLSTKEDLLKSQPAKRRIYANGFAHQGEPILLTEFGGIAFKIGSEEGWGYTSVSNEQDFVQEYRRVIEAVYASRAIHGFCYTQLTDVEQEINGLLTYDRKPKCDLNEIRKIHGMWNQEIVEA
ncbi:MULTISPECIES: glycoside hydrolase family 2 protein [unclassified Paenibacillus]|uniref:glycoside hydrolase family 2 protein n=1 Tax=unclassified Paenibacillus TaxID=185978 RepID=UPI001C125A44|nr:MULTISPECIES: sugar-binding domain-containing protein [unclassified Paenibacillus]MBU5443608.1 glycoside hydrolase family 2 [Paenibacillus sp. MSJ-34]CAH0120002.1 Beta-glucuronidase [Paenibacillus sp. CECT 9249]